MSRNAMNEKIRNLERELENLKKAAGSPPPKESSPTLRRHAFSTVGSNPDYEERLEEFTHYYHRALRIPKSRLDDYERGFMYGTAANPDCYELRFKQYGPRVPVSEAQLRFIRKLVEEKR